MRFARNFLLAILVLAPASRSAGRALQSSFCFDEKIEACVRPGGSSFYCLPIVASSTDESEFLK